MKDIKRWLKATAVLFLVGFVLGLEHNDSWLQWLGSITVAIGIWIAVFWKEVSNPRWWRYQFFILKGYPNG